MNIVIFTDTYFPKIDGIAVSIQNFTGHLIKRGFRFVICTPSYDLPSYEKINESLHIVRFADAPLPSYPDVKIVIPSRSRLDRALTIFKPDLIHVQTPGLLGQYGIFAARMLGIPVYGTYHTLISEQTSYLSALKIPGVNDILQNFVPDFLSNTIRGLDELSNQIFIREMIKTYASAFYNLCDLVISPSMAIEKELVKQHIFRPIKVISNGIDLSRFSNRIRTIENNTSYTFIHAGRLSYEKNVEVVIKAFLQIIKVFNNAKLIICGDGPALSFLKNQAVDAGQQIEFRGLIHQNELPEYYNHSHIFITASTMETQGIVVLEALASGLPCVGVDAYALPELIKHNVNGKIVPPFRPDEMADAVLSILASKEQYIEFSQQAIQTAASHKLENSIDDLEQLYKSLDSQNS